MSTAYYAVFHAVLRTAAARFVGSGQENTTAYVLLYRSFSHSSIRLICQVFARPPIPKSWAKTLGRSVVSREFRDFATIFDDLYERRQSADYDPAAIFSDSAVTDWIRDAEAAIDAFHSIPPDERTDILALMMVRARA